MVFLILVINVTTTVTMTTQLNYTSKKDTIASGCSSIRLAAMSQIVTLNLSNSSVFELKP